MSPIRTLLLALAALLLGTAPGLAQPRLYEQRLPDGYALLRYANGLAEATQLRSEFDLPRALGTEGAARVTPYHVIENVEGKTLEMQLVSGGTTQRIGFTIQPNTFNTLLLLREGEQVVARVIQDTTDFNQLRARLTFYNATTACGATTLALEPGGQAVLADVAGPGMRARTVAPAAARVRASCAGARVGPLDLGRLEAGQLVSVWMMAPAGTALLFRSTDTIAPPGR
jgi:hypothetical protein